MKLKTGDKVDYNNGKSISKGHIISVIHKTTGDDIAFINRHRGAVKIKNLAKSMEGK